MTNNSVVRSIDLDLQGGVFMGKILGNIFCFVGLHDRVPLFSRTGHGNSLMNGWCCGRVDCDQTVKPLEWPAPKWRTK